VVSSAGEPALDRMPGHTVCPQWFVMVNVLVEETPPTREEMTMTRTTWSRANGAWRAWPDDIASYSSQLSSEGQMRRVREELQLQLGNGGECYLTGAALLMSRRCVVRPPARSSTYSMCSLPLASPYTVTPWGLSAWDVGISRDYCNEDAFPIFMCAITLALFSSPKILYNRYYIIKSKFSACRFT
jgi:hypothetical protein